MSILKLLTWYNDALIHAVMQVQQEMFRICMDCVSKLGDYMVSFASDFKPGTRREVEAMISTIGNADLSLH